MQLATTIDIRLTDALTQVVTYFTTNLSPVMTAVIGVIVFLWLLKFALRSIGVTSVSLGVAPDDEGNWRARLEYEAEEDDGDDSKGWSKRWDL